MEFLKTHTDQKRENEWKLFMQKVKYALKKIGDDYCDFLTLHPNHDEKSMLDILKETGSFSYNCDGIAFDFEFDRIIYAWVKD
jgi:hypothetical protein